MAIDVDGSKNERQTQNARNKVFLISKSYATFIIEYDSRYP